MQIQTGVYSLKEFCELLNISSYVWKKRKEDLLEHLKDYFDYTIELGGYHNTEQIVTIKEVYDDYEPLPRKTQIKEKQQDYKTFTLDTIKQEPLNTTLNIARKAVEDKELKEKYHHAAYSAARYIRPIINSNKVLKGEKVWVRLDKEKNVYIPLQGEELTYILDLMKNFRQSFSEQAEEIITSMDTQDLEEISVPQYLTDILSCEYRDTLTAFEAVYGYRPFKVHHLEINALVEC